MYTNSVDNNIVSINEIPRCSKIMQIQTYTSRNELVYSTSATQMLLEYHVVNPPPFRPPPSTYLDFSTSVPLINQTTYVLLQQNIVE